MQKQTFGEMISSLRKEKGMTQLELAEKMGVTDKAVSKWERNLSFPDVSSLPRLAEIFGLSVDELLQYKTPEPKEKGEGFHSIFMQVCQALTAAMGVALIVLSVLKKIDVYDGFVLIGIGLLSAGQWMLMNSKKE